MKSEELGLFFSILRVKRKAEICRSRKFDREIGKST